MFLERITEGEATGRSKDEGLELVHRAQNGDTVAFAELVTKHRGRILALIFGIVQDEQEASEIFQRTSVKVWRAIHTFQGRSSFYTWISKIAKCETIDWLRRTRPAFVELDVNMRCTAAGPDNAIQRREIRDLVLDAINNLPPKQRAVIVLKDLEDFQYHEIADILQCSIGTVMSRLFYARRKLQIRLRPLYESLNDPGVYRSSPQNPHPAAAGSKPRTHSGLATDRLTKPEDCGFLV
jgi:RNA polymerase sigma-70 factor, ECF subfamily